MTFKVTRTSSAGSRAKPCANAFQMERGGEFNWYLNLFGVDELVDLSDVEDCEIIVHYEGYGEMPSIEIYDDLREG